MDSEYNLFTSNIKDTENHGIQTAEEITSALTSCPSSMALAQRTITVANCSSRHFSNSHHTQVRRSTDDREEDLLLESELVDDFGRPPHTDAFDTEARNRIGELLESARSSKQPSQNVSLQSRAVPQQQCCSIQQATQNGELAVKSSTRPPKSTDMQRFCDPESSHGLQMPCVIFMFKRGIIARDDLIHNLYIIPVKDFKEKFPKIKQYEGVICHGTEFPMMEETKIPPNRLFHRILIDGTCKVNFEMDAGETFSIVSPPTIVTNISEILSRSKNRVGCGFSATVLIRCTGGKDELYEGNICTKIQCGNTNLRFTMPVAYYEANTSPWLYNPQAVTAMPDEDKKVLHSCHVSLLENIGDPICICDHLYQHKIFDSEDMEEVENMTKRRDRNAFLLRSIQTRGNILDLVIDIMRGQRENQEAAAILLNNRRHGADQNNDDK